MANINIPFNCDYESINITVKCPIEGTEREEQVIIAQLKKEQEDWVFCTPGSIVSKNVKILNNEGSYEVIDSNGNFKGKIVGDILSNDGKVIVSVTDNKVSTNDLVVSNNTVLNNVTIKGNFVLENGNNVVQMSENSSPSNNSVVLLNNSQSDNMGLLVDNGGKSEFLGFSKENNMFEIKTGSTIVNNRVSGGDYANLKLNTLIAEDVILGNKEKGEQVINLHDVITADGQGSAHITTNSVVTVHHSSVFHTAVSTDTGFAQAESDVLNNLQGDLKAVYDNEKLGGKFDSNPTNTNTGDNETFNQHWLTINETDKDPKFKWWVASSGNYTNTSDRKVEYNDILTVRKTGLEVKGENGVTLINSKGESAKLDYSCLKNINDNTIEIAALKASISNVGTGAVASVDTTAIAAAIATMANETYVNTELAKKADTTELTAKADTTYVNTELAKKADTTELTAKADTTYVNTELAKKADKSELQAIYGDEITNLKSNLDSIKELADNFDGYAKLDKEYVDFDGNVEVMEELKSGSVNTQKVVVNGIDLLAKIIALEQEIKQLKEANN